MARQTYTCRRYRSFGAFTYSADLADPFGHIDVYLLPDYEPEEWQPMPFQTTDARYNRKRLESLIVKHFS